MPLWMVMKMLLTIQTDDPEDEDFTPESSDFEYDEEIADDEKSEVESYDSEINEIIPDDDLDEEVDINEEDDEDDDSDEEELV